MPGVWRHKRLCGVTVFNPTKRDLTTPSRITPNSIRPFATCLCPQVLFKPCRSYYLNAKQMTCAYHSTHHRHLLMTDIHRPFPDTKQSSTTFTTLVSRNPSNSLRKTQNWYVWDRTHGLANYFADRLPARSWAEEQWPPRQEVDERYTDAKEGKLHLFSLIRFAY